MLNCEGVERINSQGHIPCFWTLGFAIHAEKEYRDNAVTPGQMTLKIKDLKKLELTRNEQKKIREDYKKRTGEYPKKVPIPKELYGHFKLV